MMLAEKRTHVSSASGDSTPAILRMHVLLIKVPRFRDDAFFLSKREASSVYSRLIKIRS